MTMVEVAYHVQAGKKAQIAKTPKRKKETRQDAKMLNVKCKNITIKNGASEKLLGVIIDNKLDFTEHLNTVCKKTNLKLHALNRISRFLLQSSMY